MILVYAGVVPSKGLNEQREELRIRAVRLLDELDHDGVTVILPTVAIAELLVPVPASDTGKLIKELTRRFVCATFDLQAAAIAATIWAEHKKLPRDQQYKDRTALKADAMIVACAKAAGASVFYSHDRGSRAIAKIVMDTEDLPTRAENLEQIFVESDIRRGEEPPPRRTSPGKRRKKPSGD